MFHSSNKKIILASGSPRRAQLLRLIGFDCQIMPSSIEEKNGGEDDPVAHVLKLSAAKAQDVAQRVTEGVIIGADTVVVIDGKILGKPKDFDEAKAMLRRLSNRTHTVYTGFTLIDKSSGVIKSDYETTQVHFRELQDWEIDAYVRTQNPMDKAGAYGIQDQSAVFADRIEGCFYNVVGLPLTKFYTTYFQLLEKNNE